VPPAFLTSPARKLVGAGYPAGARCQVMVALNVPSLSQVPPALHAVPAFSKRNISKPRVKLSSVVAPSRICVTLR
jgi:hypothetical protein